MDARKGREGYGSDEGERRLGGKGTDERRRTKTREGSEEESRARNEMPISH